MGRMGRFGGGASVLFGFDTLSVCKACDARISEMVDFLNADRVHMQQGIFPDVQQSYILQSILNFDEVSCKVLIGATLKQNEFLKIDQTCLAEILTEEAENKQMGMNGVISPADEEQKQAEDGGGGERKEGKGLHVTLGEVMVVPYPSTTQAKEEQGVEV